MQKQDLLEQGNYKRFLKQYIADWLFLIIDISTIFEQKGLLDYIGYIIKYKFYCIDLYYLVLLFHYISSVQFVIHHLLKE